MLPFKFIVEEPDYSVRDVFYVRVTPETLVKNELQNDLAIHNAYINFEDTQKTSNNPIKYRPVTAEDGFGNCLDFARALCISAGGTNCSDTSLRIDIPGFSSRPFGKPEILDMTTRIDNE